MTLKTPKQNETRCAWASSAPDFPEYHDHEWGFPVDDDQRLFEKLCLETFQSGLSWRTILSKRDNFRLAFENFDFHKVAQFGEKEITELLNNQGIVRNKRKILAVINNAKRALEMVEKEGSLAAFIWRYEPRRKHPTTARDPNHLRGIYRPLQRTQKTRLAIRRPNYHLRLHAIHGTHQRPCGRLFSERRD
nr:DNA-3-methyladenine glycosylase I [Marinomonas sp. KJ51-3]